MESKTIGVVEAILIGFSHIFISTGYPISHKIIQKCQFMQTALALQNHAKNFCQLVSSLQKVAILATFLPYQNSPTLWGYLDTPIFQTKTRVSVSSMITMFSIMSSILKIWTMLNDVQANLLVSQKVIKEA